MKKLLYLLLLSLAFATPSYAVQKGGAGADNEQAYICGSTSANSLGNTSISSEGFVSGLLGSGWRITPAGQAEFQDITARGTIRTSVFEKDTISCVNGFLLVASGDVLDVDMTAADDSTVTIKGETTFVANEVLRMKDGTDDEWMLVTNATSAPVYTVTRDIAAAYGANANPAWTKGTAIVSMGVGTGDTTGFVLIDASSTYAPFIDVYSRNSTTYNDYTLKTRMGWLKGITDADVGLSTTDTYGIYCPNAYIKGTVVALLGEIGGWDIGTYDIKDTAGNVGLSSAVTAGDDVRVWAGGATPASAPFRVTEAGALTATNATITGEITATSGSFTGAVTATSGSFIGAISGSTIDIGGDDASSFHVDVAGGIWSGASVANKATAPFRVSNAGALVATSGSIGGFTVNSTTLANGTSIILDASNKAISINNATFGNSGIQLQYNGGAPRFYVGNGSSNYINYDGTNLGIGIAANAGGNEGIIYKGGYRWLFDFNPAYNDTVTPNGGNYFFGKNAGNLNMGSTATDAWEASSNIGIGEQTLDALEKGYDNVGIAPHALGNLTDGKYCIGIGQGAGLFQSDGNGLLQTPEQSIYIGVASRSGSDPAGGEDAIEDEIVIGTSATGNGTHSITLGTGSTASFHCQVALTVDSDKRIKKDVFPLPSTLNFVNSLVPVSYKKINPADYPDEIKSPLTKRSADDNNVYVGLIAQDLEALLKAQGLNWKIVNTGTYGKKSITYESLIMPMLKAIQELSARVAELEKGKPDKEPK